jgi:hypothetical protein
MRTEPDLEVNRREELGVALARFTWRRLFVRLFAVVTCLVALVGIWATYIAYERVNRAESAAQRQLSEIGDTFTKVANTLGHVSASATQAADSATQARTSLGSAASTTRSAADTLDQTATAIDITILGSRPFETVGVAFRDQARQLRSLADQIDRTGSSVGDNSDYLRAISADTAVMANDMTGVSQQLRQFAGYGPGSSALLQITASTRLILTWSVVVHLVLFGVGVSLFLLTIESGR